MDLLTSMAVFVRSVDQGGFTAAAKVSGISAAMVSNHIKALERRLGSKLFNRTTRRQSLTEIGRDYYTQCVDILARVEKAESIALEKRSAPKGRLRVSAALSIGNRLVDELTDYVTTYPEVELELILSDRVVDLVEDGFDAALRFGDLPDSRLVARPLRSVRRFLCASPSYLQQHGTPGKPSDLANHHCLTFHDGAPRRDWQVGSKPTIIRVSGRISINNNAALRVAAVKGLGIAMLPEYLVADDVAAGRLVRILQSYELPTRRLQLVYLPDKNMLPKLSSFVEFMCRRFS